MPRQRSRRFSDPDMWYYSNLEEKDRYGRTYFLEAIEEGLYEIAISLQEEGADVNATDVHGRNAIHLAVLSGHDYLFHQLMSWGVWLDLRDDDGRTPYLVAARNGDLAAAARLQGLGADTGAFDSRDRTALHLAAYGGHTDFVQTLLHRDELYIEDQDYRDRTPLMLAARRGHLDTAQALWDAGADLWAKDNFGRTALHLAAYAGHENMVHLLLNWGAGIAARDNWGRTPLHLAVREGRLSAARALKTRHANIHVMDDRHSSLLHEAVFMRQEESLRLLLQWGANVTVVNDRGETPLEMAENLDYQELVDIIDGA